MVKTKNIINMCVNALQKSRSIYEENGMRDLEDLISEEGFGLFDKQTEDLMWKWSNNPEPTRVDAYNAVSWLQMKFPSAALLLSMRMVEEGVVHLYDNPILILKECE